MQLLLGGYENFHIYEHEPKELTFGSTSIMMVPWITKDNAEKCFKAILDTRVPILMGHFEIKGFEMLKGTICDHGMDVGVFKDFEQVYSGHFHHPSEYSNIRYLGAPYEMTWSDYNGRRGFHILDTETRDLKWIENPFKVFHKIDYDDSDMTIDDIANLNTNGIQDAYIKVIVKNRNNPYIHDLFINKLTDGGAADVKSIEDTLNIENEGVEDILDETQDTKDILHSFIDSMETNVNKLNIKKLIDELYIEAQNVA
jgi:DNA repair exonuclease SbcCD nuclease subunit